MRRQLRLYDKERHMVPLKQHAKMKDINEKGREKKALGTNAEERKRIRVKGRYS